jgi:UDP-N-acetylmuramate dehydrogenase
MIDKANRIRLIIKIDAVSTKKDGEYCPSISRHFTNWRRVAHFLYLHKDFLSFMITIQENISLLPYNTFRIQTTARYFTRLSSVADALELFAAPIFQNQKHLFIGGGSNILLTHDFEGLVIRNEIKGIDVIAQNDDEITLKVGAGENWHDFVMYCVDKNYGGVENLSLIPGTMGAAPMQNIGAYGVEVKDTIVEVEAIHVKDRKTVRFSKEDCAFGYRESIFKQKMKDQYFISSVTLKLTRRNHHYHVSYGAIQDTLRQMGQETLSIKAVSDAVISIRRSKLPDPQVIGNAGSFFKNPSVAENIFNEIKKSYPTVPSFPGENGLTKIPAGWLIEQTGWKGKREGDIGVHQHQALVLVNYANGEGEKIWNLAMRIQSSVKEKFNIHLHPEVNVV